MFLKDFISRLKHDTFSGISLLRIEVGFQFYQRYLIITRNKINALHIYEKLKKIFMFSSEGNYNAIFGHNSLN